MIMTKWTYSMIAELERAWEESEHNISKTAAILGLSVVTTDNAIRRFFKKDSALYKRRTSTASFRASHG